VEWVRGRHCVAQDGCACEGWWGERPGAHGVGGDGHGSSGLDRAGCFFSRARWNGGVG
jgi:hypothetical protein